MESMPRGIGVNLPTEGKKKEQQSKKVSNDIAHSVNFVAGGLVSAVSKMMVYPMETKVLLMAVGESATSDPMRLWHGVMVKGVENFVYNGLLWSLKELLRPPPPDPAFPERRPPLTFIRAFAASCIAVLVSHPITNTVVKMQASLRNPAQKPLSALQAAKVTMNAHGLGGFFTGWQLSILLRVGCAATLVVYDCVRSRIVGTVGNDVSNFIAGLLGRLSEVYCNQPLKTLRFRQQLGQAMLPSLKLSEFISLWNGVGIMAVADAIKIGIRFLLIERLRTILQWVLTRTQKELCPSVVKAAVENTKAAEERSMGG